MQFRFSWKSKVQSIPQQHIQEIALSKSGPQRIYSVKIQRLSPDRLKLHPLLATKTVVPTSVDLRAKLPPVYDQGNLGSCTANALCAAYQFLDPSIGTPSRLFLYYNERVMENDVQDDNGAALSDGVKCLVQNGVCSEKTWPYIEKRFAVKPAPACYVEAAKHKAIHDYNVPLNLQSMKIALQSGLPFVTGISVFDSFESDQVAANGMVPMPDQMGENCLGGHAVLVCGYNDSIPWFQDKAVYSRNGTITIRQSTNASQKGCWIVRNSWGANWGAGGYFYLPYPYLLDPNLSGDQWIIDRVAYSKLAQLPRRETQQIATMFSKKPLVRRNVRFNLGSILNAKSGGGCGCGH